MSVVDALAEVLISENPRDDLVEKLEPFRPLIGSWDVAITWHDPDGATRLIEGEWHFGWALGGRAVADVWIAPSRAVRTRTGDDSGEWGLTLRFHDPDIDAWRSTWLGPGRNVVMPFIGFEEDGRIVLEGSFEDGKVTRWVFSDITEHTFHWENLDSVNGGATWKLRQEMTGTRQE